MAIYEGRYEYLEYIEEKHIFDIYVVFLRIFIKKKCGFKM